MAPSASAAAWRPPAKAGWVGGVCRTAGVVLAAIAAALYLAGFFFLGLRVIVWVEFDHFLIKSQAACR